jgi:hypothetical protein
VFSVSAPFPVRKTVLPLLQHYKSGNNRIACPGIKSGQAIFLSGTSYGFGRDLRYCAQRASSLILSSIPLPPLAANNPCHHAGQDFHCCQIPYKTRKCGSHEFESKQRSVFFSKAR